MASLYFFREPRREPPPEAPPALGFCDWCGERIDDAAIVSTDNVRLCPACFRAWIHDETDAQLCELLGWTREVTV